MRKLVYFQQEHLHYQIPNYDYPLYRNNVVIPNIFVYNNGGDKKAGSGTSRQKSAKTHRKDWEKGTEQTWTNEPDDSTKNQVSHHTIPLADGGMDGYPNMNL